MLNSTVCRTEHFFEPWYRRQAKVLGYDDPDAPHEARNFHRKAWEWAAITQALEEREMLKPGRRGLGFAVGNEKLPSLFASRGATVTASDIGDEAVAANWRATGQFAGQLDGLYYPDTLDRAEFDRLVTYRPLDMRDLSGLEKGAYDFVWSACALEHLGRLEDGLRFILASTELLAPGGVGVHTTEYNLSSRASTVDRGDTVIYRERDLHELDGRLRDIEAGLVTLDLDGGTHEYDIKPDYEPYHANGRKHLKLKLKGFVSTSVLLIVQR